MTFKRALPLACAILFGLLALIGLLFLPPLADLLLGWTAFLAAVALFLGVINLFRLHARRAWQGNGYSAVLVISMVAVLTLGVTDWLGLTQDGVPAAFTVIQAPLEAALAALLAFFLLSAAVLLLSRVPSRWSALFIAALVIFLLASLPLSGVAGSALAAAGASLSAVIVTGGIRAILIGVALGTVTLALRLLAGLERPYDK